MKIIFTGGGTGGHVFPIVAVAREIQKLTAPLIASGKLKGIDLVYIGPKDQWAASAFPEEGIEIKSILAGKIRRYFSPVAIILNIFDLFKLVLGTIQAFFWIFIESPDLVFSKGGYGSIPVVISAKILQVPVFLHESDASPGLANRFSGKFAIEIFASFPKTKFLDPKKIIVVGSPLRENIAGGNREDAKDLFKLSGKKPVLLILGGSQGSQRINDLILLILSRLLETFEIIHQCGSKNFKNVEPEAKAIIKKEQGKYYHPFPFLKEHEIKQAYAAADLIITRAGAGTIFEIAACAKPSIMIPLPEAAQNHQVKNAHALAQAGATLVIEEANITPHFFLEKVQSLMITPSRLEQMGKAALEFSRPRAAQVIANYLLAYLTT